MATQPGQPDIITPQSPPEIRPLEPSPDRPDISPPETIPPDPGEDDPEPALPETPAEPGPF